jgi:hypothetical protein
MLDLMQQELDFSRGEALTLASLTVDLIRRPAFTYRSSSVPGKPRTRLLQMINLHSSCSVVLEAAAHEKKIEKAKDQKTEDKIGSPRS